jgi:hypothetical protein
LAVSQPRAIRGLPLETGVMGHGDFDGNRD